MGLGKTILMGTCIFYEFLLAKKYPKDKRFCHNALVFAPDKTVLQSLREIMIFDKTKVVPPEYARVLDSNIKFHFLDESGTVLHTIDDSDFNIIISNTQKIIIKKKRIVKIIEDGITTPRMDGTRGSALYAIPFQLSRTPSSEWIKFFLEEWEGPPRFTSMHRPGIASVIGNRIILDGTTIDEVKEFHRDTLKLCVNEANKRELRYIALKQQERERKAQQKAEHMNHVSSVIDEIEF